MHLTLRAALIHDMPFRRRLLSDPETMAYNAPWFPPDGCIPFPETQWQTWLDEWTNHEPERFCGYLFDGDTPVGEVCWNDFGTSMGIVILGDCRGHGYGREGLRLLVERAFNHGVISVLQNTFESSRDAALAMHLRAGFVPVREKNGLFTLRLTRERWQSLHRTTWLRAVFDAMCEHDRGESERIHHFIKVHGFARQIALHERLDENTLFTLEVAALTHDIGIKPALERHGRCSGDLQEQLGPPAAEAMLKALDLPAPVIRRVSFLIGHHHTTRDVAGVDWQILLEADFLVNMIEGNCTQEAIDTFKRNVFKTAEGIRLLEQVRPAR